MIAECKNLPNQILIVALGRACLRRERGHANIENAGQTKGFAPLIRHSRSRMDRLEALEIILGLLSTTVFGLNRVFMDAAALADIDLLMIVVLNLLFSV
jgi:hypothetical protein